MKKILIFIFVFSAQEVYSQVEFDTAAIKAQLKIIFIRDQKTRIEKDSVGYMKFIDSTNLCQLEPLLERYGWMGRSMVGDTANSAIFLVIQHSNLETQLKYLPMLQKSVENGDSRPSNLALMQDRILMRQGKKQIYGSQVITNASGGYEFYPIEDEANVNMRRAKIGMSPLEDYAKFFGIEYQLPQK